MFSEYACAEAGIPHVLDEMGKSRVEPPGMDGGPKTPVVPCPERVSATRHGVTGMNRRPVGPVAPDWVTANVWPPIVIELARADDPELAAIVTATWVVPVPEPGAGVSQVSLAVAVHPHDVMIFTDVAPPEAGAEYEPVERAYVQPAAGAAWVTVNAWLPMIIKAAREEGPIFAVKFTVRVKLPVPALEEALSQTSLGVAVHAHGVVTVTVVEPAVAGAEYPELESE
jgi:hypothetical protein